MTQIDLTGGEGGAIKSEVTTVVAEAVYDAIRQLGERVRTVGVPPSVPPVAELEQLPVQR